MIQTGGECVVVIVDEVGEVIRQWGRGGRQLLWREAERTEGQMDLRFLNESAFFFWDGDVGFNFHGDCQVVRNVEVEAGEVMYC